MTSAELPFYLASPASSPCLPVELLAQIVDEAAGDRDELDYTTLRHLCLTSKSILPFARQALYRQIWLSFKDRQSDVDELRDFEGDFDGERQLFTTNGDKIEATLRAAPHLAQSATSLMLACKNEITSTITLLCHFLRSIPHLCRTIRSCRTCDMSAQETEVVLTELQLSLSSIAELEVNMVPGVFDLLANSGTLQHLRLRGVDVEYYDNLGARKSPSLKSRLLSIELDDFEFPLPLFEELGHHSDSLRRLSLPLADLLEMAPRLVEFPALSYLDICLPIFRLQAVQ